MRQRRSGVRSETTAARPTRHNLARGHATIYPVLTFKPHPLTPSPHMRRGERNERTVIVPPLPEGRGGQGVRTERGSDLRRTTSKARPPTARRSTAPCRRPCGDRR